MLKSVRGTAGERIGTLVAPNAGWADAKAAARLHGVLVHCGVYRLHELVHIVAPPVRERQIAAGRLIGGGIVKLRGRIKIIVELDAIHGVFADDFRHAVTDELAHLCDAGIEIIAAVTRDHPFRMLLGGRGIRQGIEIALRIGTGTDAVRIDPRLQPQIAGMCLFYPIRERVKRIGRRRAAGAGQIPAPRKELGAVQRIAGRAHLKIHGVGAARRDAVECGAAFGAQRVCVSGRLRGIINGICRCHPDAARLRLHGRGGR